MYKRQGKGLDATFMGLMWGSNAAFGAAAGILVGTLVKFTSWEMAFYAAAAMFFVGFLVSLVMPRGGSMQTQPATRKLDGGTRERVSGPG